MAVLTRQQRAAITHALHDAERAHAYIMRPDIAVARREPRASSMTLAYNRPALSPEAALTLGVSESAASLIEVNRDYGSDLTGLAMAIATLRGMLALDDEIRRQKRGVS